MERRKFLNVAGAGAASAAGAAASEGGARSGEPVRASSLPEAKQEEIRNAYRHEMTEALVKYVRAHPPDVDIDDVRIVMKPNQALEDWDIAQCSTCGTCNTCDTCGTCATSFLA